jgi:hypothetical protein
MSKHSHKWLTQFFAFPEEGNDAYEEDEPYEVQYCSDRECGQRRVVTMSEDLIKNVREFNGYPPEQVEGGEE